MKIIQTCLQKHQEQTSQQEQAEFHLNITQYQYASHSQFSILPHMATFHINFISNLICAEFTFLLYKQNLPTWKVHRHAPKKAWVKQVEDSLKNRHLTLVDAKILSTYRLAWGQIVEVARKPSGPRAAYVLRTHLWHSAS